MSEVSAEVYSRTYLCLHGFGLSKVPVVFRVFDKVGPT